MASTSRMGSLAERGRAELERMAEVGRVRLELRQLRRDREAMLSKLGREVVNLVDGGEVDHPGLVRGAGRIREVEGRIAEVEKKLSAVGTVAAEEEEESP